MRTELHLVAPKEPSRLVDTLNCDVPATAGNALEHNGRAYQVMQVAWFIVPADETGEQHAVRALFCQQVAGPPHIALPGLVR